MSSTMLALANQVANELGLPQLTTVAGNTSQEAVQLLALLNRQGYNLLKEYDWRALENEYRFYTQMYTYEGDTVEGSYQITNLTSTTGLNDKFMLQGDGINQDTTIVTVDSATQVTVNQKSSQTGRTSINFCQTKYDLPPDYETITDRTQWDKTKHWMMLGPESAQQWQWLKSGYISTGPRMRWRILGQFFQVWPMPTTQEFLGFEYRSKGWVRTASDVIANSFTADTDTCIYDDTIMVLGTKLLYWQIKGFDTTALQQQYDRYLSTAKANDKGSPNLSFAPYPSEVLISWANIPDTGYGT